MARGGKSKAIARRGLMLVLSSPSGAGKTTLSRMLLTPKTRHRAVDLGDDAGATRRGEVNGRHYHFIDRKKFDQMVKAGELLEYAEVFGNVYGTPRKPVEKALKARPRRAVRHRLAGHAAIARARAATIWSACFCCRRRAANWRGGCTPARRTTRR